MSRPTCHETGTPVPETARCHWCHGTWKGAWQVWVLVNRARWYHRECIALLDMVS